MDIGKLTALAVDRAHRSGKPLMLSDGGGLYLRKQTKGGASWTMRYRFAGQEHWLALGNYPDMSLAEARVEARTARVQLDKQQNPISVRRKAKADSLQRGSFRELCEDWFKCEIVDRGIKYPQVPRRYLDNHLIPRLGRISAAEVTPADVAKLLDDLKTRAPTAANDLLRFARRIFAFGIRRNALLSNPAGSFSPRLDGGGTEKGRDRALDTDEIAKLFAAIHATPSFGGENSMAIRLLLSLCVRKGELLGAKWAEFDLDGVTKQGPVWHLPGARSKTGASLDIPLVPTVVTWLKGLQILSGRSEFVFPRRKQSRRQRAPHMSFDTLNVAMARVDHGLEHFTIHDLRRTARTQLATLGVRSEVAERCLGHQLGGVEGTYNRHDYFEERRRALALWTDVIVDAERGMAKVVPIKRVPQRRG
jgi:integrase